MEPTMMKNIMHFIRKLRVSFVHLELGEYTTSIEYRIVYSTKREDFISTVKNGFTSRKIELELLFPLSAHAVNNLTYLVLLRL